MILLSALQPFTAVVADVPQPQGPLTQSLVGLLAATASAEMGIVIRISVLGVICIVLFGIGYLLGVRTKNKQAHDTVHADCLKSNNEQVTTSDSTGSFVGHTTDIHKGSKEQPPLSEATTAPVHTPTSDELFIARAYKIVEQHIDDSAFSIEAFAAEMHLSHSILAARLQRITSLSPIKMIREVRMQRAAELIASKKHDITTISCMVGFSDPKYFTRVFKSHFGVPPSQYAEERTIAE